MLETNSKRKQVINYLIILLAFLILTSCTEKSEKTSVSPSTFELLQGDWVTEKHPKGFFINYFQLEIEDSLFTLFSKRSDSVRFSIEKELITVYDSTNNDYFGKNQKYQVSILNAEKLVLVVKSHKVKHRLKEVGWNSDTLVFRKLQKKNDLEPLRIGFSSSVCFGFCPSMKLEINHRLRVKFFGSVYTKIQGGYKGKIDEKQYNNVIRWIQSLPLDSLKPDYAAPWTDDQTKYLLIETKDTIIRTKTYGDFMQPVELSLLMNNLMDIYKGLNLKKEESINDERSFDPFLKMSYPTPPPPMKED